MTASLPPKRDPNTPGYAPIPDYVQLHAAGSVFSLGSSLFSLSFAPSPTTAYRLPTNYRIPLLSPRSTTAAHHHFLSL
ncbi:hypothetical protein PAAG_11177 [Paracoccidioides lutzii Pb01]|uniref:Uncharacterized protein n=1 Tax=Paracoccidioides lutzii (strain ATCC MYA-826 / Pb01) TaxID=502779 RepID=A0A0A2V3D2_PARBA|nr:hypothetical protein PAAG_11177 [Paracoccidioides lutzii Pb01]KGQ02003.1 hypothetical protein PAAG_11177 [Paracoccidioides lutzii Pb01]